jgi:NAD(P)-dependent dehydrogenase (short-subunit alcohol dehydrogenase family)
MSAVEVPTTSEPEPEPAAAEEGETSSVGAGRKVMILGGDGFVGWPTATHLSALGYEVAIVDNCSRRTIDVELGTSSAIPIAGPEERVAAWERVSGKKIAFINCDVAKDFAGLIQCIAEFQPATICHFAEQRSAPYSMLSTTTKQYTVRLSTGARLRYSCTRTTTYMVQALFPAVRCGRAGKCYDEGLICGLGRTGQQQRQRHAQRAARHLRGISPVPQSHAPCAPLQRRRGALRLRVPLQRSPYQWDSGKLGSHRSAGPPVLLAIRTVVQRGAGGGSVILTWLRSARFR